MKKIKMWTKEKQRDANRRWRLRNPEKRYENQKKWLLEQRIHSPVTLIFNNIKLRCFNKKHSSYKNYGGRGIKCMITKNELKYLWERDNAKYMKRPSIDRIDNNGNYELSNCRFIELSENLGRSKIKTVCIRGHSFSGDNVKFWKIKGGGMQKICIACNRIRNMNKGD